MNCAKCGHEMRPPQLGHKIDDFVPFWECPSCHHVVNLPTDHEYHKEQVEFATKMQQIEEEAAHQLSVVGWFLLMSAICTLGEPSVTVFPKLSHSHSKIEALGETYKDSLARLSQGERDTIQVLYKRFLDSLSYGQPTLSDLRD